MRGELLTGRRWLKLKSWCCHLYDRWCMQMPNASPRIPLKRQEIPDSGSWRWNIGSQNEHQEKYPGQLDPPFQPETGAVESERQNRTQSAEVVAKSRFWMKAHQWLVDSAIHTTLQWQLEGKSPKEIGALHYTSACSLYFWEDPQPSCDIVSA